MKDGIIKLDTDRGKQFSFTSDKYSGYLWKIGNYIIISFIESKGYLLNLFNAILRKGYGIKVPTPSVKMEKILKLKGFSKTFEYDEELGEVEIWVFGKFTKRSKKL